MRTNLERQRPARPRHVSSMDGADLFGATVDAHTLSISKSTLSDYRTAYNSYVEFCAEHGINPLPVGLYNAGCWLVWRTERRNAEGDRVSHTQTLGSSLSALKTAVRKAHGDSSIAEASKGDLAKIITGLQLKYADVTKKTRPVTLDIIIPISGHLAAADKVSAAWVAVLATWSASARVGETLAITPRCLTFHYRLAHGSRRLELQADDAPRARHFDQLLSKIVVILNRSKTTTRWALAKRYSVVRREDHLDATSDMMRMARKLNGAGRHDVQLWRADGASRDLTSRAVVALLRRGAQRAKLGINLEDITARGLRGGGTTDMVRSRSVGEGLRRRQGGWRTEEMGNHYVGDNVEDDDALRSVGASAVAAAAGRGRAAPHGRRRAGAASRSHAHRAIGPPRRARSGSRALASAPRAGRGTAATMGQLRSLMDLAGSLGPT